MIVQRHQYHIPEWSDLSLNHVWRILQECDGAESGYHTHVACDPENTLLILLQLEDELRPVYSFMYLQIARTVAYKIKLLFDILRRFFVEWIFASATKYSNDHSLAEPVCLD